ncbi:hypothetical protein PIB30_098711, partial [Stylosanthes scabra]|nr:hypothetical protein [Stylosanthes scabra]
MARLHTSRVRAMALVRPHGELGHIRPNYQASWRARAPLLARPHGPRVRAMALARPRDA